jgi:methionine sulfoxide reductase heme-binding subunit
MSSGQPLQMVWWLVSRASGIVALVLVSVSVVIGLAMAAKVLRRPSLKRGGARLHQHLALTGLAAIGVHGLALLGDTWLKPGWRGITIPFALSYRPGFTGIGIIAGYLAVLLGPSFYLRRRIGARRWRALHRATVLVWLLSAVHALGAGSDGASLWLRAVVVAPLVPIVYLMVVRVLGSERTPARPEERRRRPEPAHHDHRLDRLDRLEVASEVSRPWAR